MSSWSEEDMEATISEAFKEFLKTSNSSENPMHLNDSDPDTIVMRGREYCYSPEHRYYIWCNTAQFSKRVEPISTCKFDFANEKKML